MTRLAPIALIPLVDLGLDLKRTTLLKRIAKAASEAGVKLDLVREGGEHSVYQCGVERFTVPRHREVNELTALGILRHLESEFGSGWWR